MYGDGDCDIRIQKHQNGYTVRITDPAIVAANKKRDEANRRSSKGECAPCEPWRDPQVSYAFSNRDEVTAFIKANIDKALPVDEFSSTFDKAVKDSK